MRDWEVLRAVHAALVAERLGEGAEIDLSSKPKQFIEVRCTLRVPLTDSRELRGRLALLAGRLERDGIFAHEHMDSMYSWVTYSVVGVTFVNITFLADPRS